MEGIEALFTKALKLEAPWKITGVELRPKLQARPVSCAWPERLLIKRNENAIRALMR